MDGKQYSELGDCLDTLARRRNVRGPYPVARFVRERTGEGPKGSAWRQFFVGDARPKPVNVKLFCAAFDLTEEERRWLADVYTFRGLGAAA